MLKLNVGLSRKIGEANYGSRGASVNLEMELESGLASDPQQLQDRIRQLFRLARASVDEELGAGGSSQTNGKANGYANGHANGSAATNGNGNGSPRYATLSQIRAIHAIAERLGLDLASELDSRFAVDRPENLSIRQASDLIDALKSSQGNAARR